MSITAELWKLRFFQIVFITTIPLFWFVVLNIPNERATSWHWLQVFADGVRAVQRLHGFLYARPLLALRHPSPASYSR